MRSCRRTISKRIVSVDNESLGTWMFAVMTNGAGRWCCTPLTPALEFEAGLSYRASSSAGSKATEKTYLEKKKKKRVMM